jgi:hypothetical protein
LDQFSPRTLRPLRLKAFQVLNRKDRKGRKGNQMLIQKRRVGTSTSPLHSLIRSFSANFASFAVKGFQILNRKDRKGRKGRQQTACRMGSDGAGSADLALRSFARQSIGQERH